MRAVENGAAVLTASRRLARVLTRQFNSGQRNQGRSVWRSPAILPLDAYLRQCWRDWIAAGLSGGQPPVLLSPAQERAVWEQIIRESAQGDSLLRIPETAAAASEAWRLARAYRLPIDAHFEANEDSSAFLGWAKTFRNLCDERNWLEEVRLSDTVASLLQKNKLAKLSKALLAGFDEFTPQQLDLIAALGEHEELPRVRHESRPACYRARDNSEEIRLAARWARAIIQNNPDAHIGVVVLELSGLRAKVERIFSQELDPTGAFDDRERAFHLSLGEPLGAQPVIHAAFEILEFASREIPLAKAGALLRSPFLGGAESERFTRAALDARIRRRGFARISLMQLRGEAAACPELQRIAQRAQTEIEKSTAVRSPAEWARRFSKILRAFGWPGERAPDSREYQIIAAWQDLLSTLAELDTVLRAVSFEEALDKLRMLAADRLFQVENEGAPIGIMGALEASGLSFDHLWVMGLHDAALPAPARPNPFLPLSLQREHGLPHASADRELEFAKKILDRLLTSAPDVVLSYAVQVGESVFAPTPLLPGVEWRVPGAGGTPAWIAAMKAGATLETFSDETGPALAADSQQTGGSTLFQDIAACPFRAFVRHRLHARPLEDAPFALDARNKGTLAHKALELIWAELKSRDELSSLGQTELADLVSRNVKAALDQHVRAIGRYLEQIRLERLLTDWLAIEKNRPPFQVLPPEQKRVVRIGGIAVHLRIDRVDELPDKRVIILDYKTGDVKSGAWSGDRPADPQVPLYCATSGARLAGAALVQIQSGNLKMRGIDESGSLPDLKPMQTDNGRKLSEQIEDWKQVLTALAGQFRTGHAEVDPSPGACEYCGAVAVCRVREAENV